MRWFRGLGRVLGGSLLIALLVPALAAWPAAFLDRGPSGSVRRSLFPMALAVFDPFVWECLRNSVLVAAGTAAGSLGIGVGLGWIAGPRRFRGRGLLWAPALAPLAAGPLLIAPSLASMLGGAWGWEWLASRTIFGESAEVVARWAGLAWTGLAWGAPMVALTASSALRRVPPAWSEAARAVGATKGRAWLDVAWPTLRPEVARAASMVFTLALVEPAGPLVFELRRTLAVQIIQASTRLDQPTRAATLAVLAILVSIVGRTLIRRWGGPSYARADRLEVTPAAPVTFRDAWGMRLILASWCGLTTLPIGLWAWRTIERSKGSRFVSWPATLENWRLDVELRGWVVNSLAVAGLAITLDLILLRLLSRGAGGRAVRLASRFFRAVPPLALGVGALATPWLLDGLADRLGGPIGRVLRGLALELSPGRSPGFLLVLTLAAGSLPMLAGVAALVLRQIRPSRSDAARQMGESEARASRAGSGRSIGVVPVLPAFLAFGLAATNLTPALLLTPFSERMTLAPAVLGFLLGSGPYDARAVGPIAVLVALNLLSLALGSRGRYGPPTDWAREHG